MVGDSSGSNVAISVIMPCFNNEATIELAVRSLAMQPDPGQGRLEFVVVDDGSTDRTLDRIKELAASLPDFGERAKILVHERNRGASAAYATGALAAAGEWLGRLDADDYVDPGYFGRLLSEALKAGAEVVVAPMAVHDAPGIMRKMLLPVDPSSLNSLALTTVNFSFGNKLIRRSALLGSETILPVEGIDCWDDLSVIARVYALGAKRVVAPAALPYHYVSPPGAPSLSRTRKEKILEDHIACAAMLDKWFAEHRLAEAHEPFLTRLKFISKVKYLRGKGKDPAAWKATFPEVNGKIWGIKGVAPWHRLAFMAVDLLPAPLVRALTLYR